MFSTPSAVRHVTSTHITCPSSPRGCAAPALPVGDGVAMGPCGAVTTSAAEMELEASRGPEEEHQVKGVVWGAAGRVLNRSSAVAVRGQAAGASAAHRAGRTRIGSQCAPCSWANWGGCFARLHGDEGRARVAGLVLAVGATPVAGRPRADARARARAPGRHPGGTWRSACAPPARSCKSLWRCSSSA